MRRLILGTAGHIDHGKTTLIRALTGVDTDRLPEEKRRGITIDLGFANLPLADGLELGVVDVPGHEGFIRNMLAGATGIDVVLLTVAADEGIMPQTREHLAIVELLGVRSGVVAVTKADLVESEWLELVVEDLRETLAATAFARAPVLPVSAVTGAGLEALRDALAAAAATAEERRSDDLFRLPVDRVFTVRGTGTVVTGTVWSGRVARDETVRLLPRGSSARIRSVQVHGREREDAGAGQRVALALVGVEKDEVHRGDVLVSAPSWEPARMLTARLRLLDDAAWSVRPRQRVRFHLGTSEVMARTALLEGGEVAPGGSAWVQLRLEAPVVARAGDRFVIRSYSPVTTIGGGRIVEPAPPKRKRLREGEAARLAAVLDPDPAAAVAARVRAAGWRGVAAARLPVDTPHRPAEVEAAVEAGVADGTFVRVGERVLAGEAADRARTLLADALAAFHREQPLRPGMDREELRRALPPAAPAGLAEQALNRLLEAGEAEIRGGLVAAAGFSPRLSGDEARARDRLLAALEQGGLAPPTLAELPADLKERPDFWPILKLLEHEGRLVAVTPELYFTRDTLEKAAAAVRRELAGRDALGPADFRTVLPVTRKYLIPLLEYLDRTGVTVRRGDARLVAAPAGPPAQDA